MLYHVPASPGSKSWLGFLVGVLSAEILRKTSKEQDLPQSTSRAHCKFCIMMLTCVNYETVRVLYGAVFPIGSVRFGAVNRTDRTEPHRRIFALFKTEPHRTVGFTISENRTEPHRRT